MINNLSSPALSQKMQSYENSADLENIHKWIKALNNIETRENALNELSKKREQVPELAPLLWNSFGTIAALLHEICAIYPCINPPNLSAVQSNRVCNALALLQVLASHNETRSEFLKANIPLYLYTFLSTNNRSRPFEYLRLTSLGVIGTLVKTDESEVITFLLGSEIIPLCLLIMENGSELSRTVATFIMEKLLLDEVGLTYICQTYDRFAHVAGVLQHVVAHLAKDPSIRLFKHVVRCYLRLSDDSRARDALKTFLPSQLTDGTFNNLLEKDMSTKRWLNQLLRQIKETSGSATTSSGPTVNTSTHNNSSNSNPLHTDVNVSGASGNTSRSGSITANAGGTSNHMGTVATSGAK